MRSRIYRPFRWISIDTAGVIQFHRTWTKAKNRIICDTANQKNKEKQLTRKALVTLFAFILSETQYALRSRS